MPRLHGYRERNPFDFYDCFSPVALAREKGFDIRLFGNANVGIPARSNMQIGNQLASDQTAVVMNVRARTNIWPADTARVVTAMTEFAHTTQVHLIVGERPIRNFTLNDLLDREPRDIKPFAKPDGSDDEVDTQLDRLAAKLYQKHHDGAYGDGPWAELPDVFKNRWRDVARTARDDLQPNRPVIIPVRQSFAVAVSCEMRSLRKLAEVLVGNQIAPEPLIWVHLEGVAVRDVG